MKLVDHARTWRGSVRMGGIRLSIRGDDGRIVKHRLETACFGD